MILEDDYLTRALEADLLSEYHGSIDLLDYWRGTLSERRLLMAIEMLTPDSRVKRALSQTPDTSSVDVIALQMQLINELRLLRAEFGTYVAARAGKRKRHTPEFMEMPRSQRKLSRRVEFELERARRRHQATAKAPANIAQVGAFIKNLGRV